MPPRDQPADEPYESRDLELGRCLQSWAEANAASPLDLELVGPLDAPGMDPTWILRMSGSLLEAEVHLFYGPRVDISAFSTQDPQGVMFVAGEDAITEQRLIAMLNALERMNRGDAVPTWLRHPSGP
ncbi:hypothetical protein [Krasilnikovia sp. M28-CT-15]|uniref:hypothetical protein n=1 Tax=Krasilnikovia sp. M28-CT-15 TaxID=3373540 RepID=UPI003875D0B2